MTGEYIRCSRKINSTHFEIAFGKAFGSTTSTREHAYSSRRFFPLLFCYVSPYARCTTLLRHIACLVLLSSDFALQSFYYVWQICFLLLFTSFSRPSCAPVYISCTNTYFFIPFYSFRHFHLTSYSS